MRINFNTVFGSGEILVVSSWGVPDQLLVRGSSKEIKAVIRSWLDKSYGATGHPLTELASPQDLHAAVMSTTSFPFLLGQPLVIDGNETTEYQINEGVME